MSPTKVCSIAGCGKTGKIRRGYCDMHYARWNSHGDPHAVKQQNSIVRTLDDIRKRVEVENECWNWKGALNTSGYAWMSFRGRSIAASRVVWQLANGSIPKGMFVLHRCDNRKCVNPGHLFLGTNADNMADMVAKGRSPRSRAKLTRESVLLIRSSNLPMQQIADLHGVSRSTVYYIRTNRTWSHL